jgi:hypothetical protein
VNQCVRSFVLLNGLLVHEKTTDQAASLRRGEFLTSGSSGYLRCHGSCNRAPLIAEGHGCNDGCALISIQLDERTDPLRPQQLYLIAASQEVGDLQNFVLRGAFLVQSRWVIPGEHLPVRTGALLQRRDVVANERVHHMVGGEVVIVEVLDPLYRGLQTSNAR